MSPVRLKRVETSRPVKLALDHHEGGYQRDSFSDGALPGARGELRLTLAGGHVFIEAVRDGVGVIVGVIPVEQASFWLPMEGIGLSELLRQVEDSK